ncbi:Fis family transcriptional regulator [Enterobacteriaceae bacterium 4M9]|nr:Fis family transcriptional regulator [Enterobacteriaceae bacterium 4M9]
MKNVLTLLDSKTREQLMFDFLELNQRRPRYEALMVGMVNAAEQHLECYAVCGTNNLNIQRFETSLHDVSHPLIHVLRSGMPFTWQTLLRGIRIEEPRLRHFIYDLPGECGMHARPVFDNQSLACGIIAAFSREPESCSRSGSLFSFSSELFQYQLKNICELDTLRRHLHQIQDVFRSQQQKQKQLDELITTLSSGMPKGFSGIAKDYSDVDDLYAALERFECEVLTQRLRQFPSDKRRIAMSLNLSPRTLSYKLSKYGCEL